MTEPFTDSDYIGKRKCEECRTIPQSWLSDLGSISDRNLLKNSKNGLLSKIEHFVTASFRGVAVITSV